MQFLGTDGDDFIFNDDFGHDIMRGFAGNDAIYGGIGNDSLYGNTGDDTLNGGAGNDDLWGGYGADSFIFGLNRHHDGDVDTIHDYQADRDQIYIAANPKTVEIRIRNDKIVVEGNDNKIVVMVENADPGDIFII